MKKIRFIRHSNLSRAYSDYNRLSFKEVSDLATHRVSPDINPETKQLLEEKLPMEFAEKIDLIICSQMLRTIQTAEVVLEAIGRDVEIEKNANLDEIHFDPAELTTEEKYKERGLDEIRMSLFENMQIGDRTESVKQVLERIVFLEKQLREKDEQVILCITHSFFMRLLRLYFIEGIRDPDELTVSRLMVTKDDTYFEGFDVNL